MYNPGDVSTSSLQPTAFETLLTQSRGVDGHTHLTPDTRRWLGGLEAQLPPRFWLHTDTAAQRAARRLGAAGFVYGDRIFVDDGRPEHLDAVLRHELVHLAQVQLAARTGRIAPSAVVEHEAEAISALPVARPVRHGADPQQLHPLVWFVAIGVGLYVLLRPGVANAPGPRDTPIPGPSPGQIIAEALCLFVVPAGAIGIGARLGLGFLGRMALAGAATNVSLRATSDVARGQASPPLMYLFDATTGAVIGFVVPGGFRLIGRAGTYGLDRLATYGVSQSDIALTRVLAERAAQAPLTAVQAQQILSTRGMAGQVSQWWLNRRGVIVLYRGQDIATGQILSPLARQEGVAASQELVARMRTLGLSDAEIAGYTARWHTQPIPPFAAPEGLAGLPLGSTGIPTTNLPGIAANFGDEGVIYVIRMPRSQAISPLGWQGLQLENEFVILNQVPSGSIVRMIPAQRVAPLMVNESGLLVPGR
ncbi:DUF4157 domain-containing protein [Reyranella sp. CPCC 100927]|uniref:eCIS core domain-containing protein n=1 Tax=Reyranella sp. CPCC 100927 TaxID=2599616 RepID=UPI0011B7A8F5|nr:DUF4157 domain-containing protein [Reyranella sp. CPCC 100927]TWS99637.1 DUF4157 domain-containing protein [Reyranella sp. CPCC 100927]